MDKVALVSALLVKVFDKFSAVGLEFVEPSPLIIITVGVNCNTSNIRQLKTNAGYVMACVPRPFFFFRLGKLNYFTLGRLHSKHLDLTEV